MNRLEKGRLYHCRREDGGQTGHLSIEDDAMSVQLFDYDQFFHVKAGKPLHLRLEDSRLVSMHNTIAGGTGNRSVRGEKSITTYVAKIHANILVVGQRPWQPDDPIRRTWFRVKKAKGLLEYAKMVRQLASRSLSLRAGDTQLFELRSRDLTVRCWYGGAGSFDLGLNEWWPVFEIEFGEPRTLHTYLDDVHRLLRFFSAAAGFLLTPSEISVSAFTAQENEERLERNTIDDQFHVEYLWDEAKVREFDLHPSNSFVCAFDAREIRSMSTCLAAWLDRTPAWEEASTLMMGSLDFHSQFSGDRLLMACRWLEKVPGANAQRTLAEADLSAISEAALQEAGRRGLLEMGGRITGALRSLRSEANRDRFARLVESVRKRFPDCGLDETTVDHLMLAQKLRGVVAHGMFEPEAGSAADLHRAFTAMEAVSYLLMIKDLPLTAKARGRATSSRLVRDYRYAKSSRDRVAD